MKSATIAALMLALLAVPAVAADTDDPPVDPPIRARFQPWQRIWQCNDIRVTVTAAQPGAINYDLGGTIWGGSQFTFSFAFLGGHAGEWLHFNGRPCAPLR
jgi:opacity protein-like surface antigen